MISVCLFGDDCFLYRNIHSLQDCLILQEDLDSLGLLEADMQMKFNVAKCLSMRVTGHYSHKQIIHDYTLHQQTLAELSLGFCKQEFRAPIWQKVGVPLEKVGVPLQKSWSPTNLCIPYVMYSIQNLTKWVLALN